MLQKAGEKTVDSSLANTRSSSSSLLDLAGSKLRKKLGSSLQESAAAPVSDFARKQLEKMGWREGTGLGKKRDGIKTHIRVKKRKEQAGLGTEKAADEKRQASSEEWWKDSLGDTLAKLSRKKNKKSSSSKKRKRLVTDEELFEATGGIRFGTKGAKVSARTKNLAMLQRTEKTSDDAPASSIIVSESDNSMNKKKEKKGKEDDKKPGHEIAEKKRRKEKSKDAKAGGVDKKVKNKIDKEKKTKKKKRIDKEKKAKKKKRSRNGV